MTDTAKWGGKGQRHYSDHHVLPIIEHQVGEFKYFRGGLCYTQ